MRVLLMLVVAILAGCAEAPEVIDEAPEACAAEGLCAQEAILEGERDLRLDLIAEDRLSAPVWKIGDVFEQHMYFGEDDREGRHIKTMVVDVNNGYTIATSDPEASSFDAVYDYPILGHIGKGLETAAFGNDWAWMYDWPLFDGKTWTGSLDDAINWNDYTFNDYEFTLTATYVAAIDTPKGDFPGFEIRGITTDGETLLEYNYVPAVGWFSHFWMYDLNSGGDEIQFHAMSMGTSSNYTGEYWLSEATDQLNWFYGHFPDPETADPGIEGDPAPQTYTLPDDAERMMGIVVPIAGFGQTTVELTDPSGQIHSYKWLHSDPNKEEYFDVFWLDDDVEAGEWNARIVPGAVFSGAYVWINSVDMELHEM